MLTIYVASRETNECVAIVAGPRALVKVTDMFDDRDYWHTSRPCFGLEGGMQRGYDVQEIEA